MLSFVSGFLVVKYPIPWVPFDQVMRKSVDLKVVDAIALNVLQGEFFKAALHI